MSQKTNISFLASVCASALLVSPVFASAQSVSAPTLTLTISKTSIVVGNFSYNDLPTISWSSTNATACQAFGTGWSGKVLLTGNQKVNPSVTTVYSMICTGVGGSIIKSVTLSVAQPSITNSQSASVFGAYNQMTTTGQTAGTVGTQTSTGFKHNWNRTLQRGSPYADDISALQTVLTLEGVYFSEITGGFYNKTLAAVKLFQTKYAIEAVGIVGPLTRAKLNALYGN